MKSKSATNKNSNKNSKKGSKPKQAKAGKNARPSDRPRRQAFAAAAYSTGQSTQVPYINASRASSRIRHRELIANISGSPTWSVVQYSLNPGQSMTFPWLATQAIGWEQYRFNMLKFCYYTRTGSTTVGSILLSPDYDALDASPESEFIASAYQDTVEDAPWKDLECVCDPLSMHPDGNRKFVRTVALTGNYDLKTYDVGNLFIGTTDGAAVTWGKLWVEYDVTFYTPQLPSAGGSFGEFQSYVGTPSSANLVGTSTGTASGNSILTSINGEILTFLQGGDYLVNYLAQSTSGGSVSQAAVPTLSSGSSFLNYGLGGTGVTTIINSAGTLMSQAFAASMVEGGTVTFNNAITSGLKGELSLLPVPSVFF
jgi:hypothetical protein